METQLEIRLHDPNPLFTRWLERWLRDAQENNRKSQHKLRQALDALRSYPLPVYSGTECAVLRGFGTTLCQMIDEELRQYRSLEKQTQRTATSTAAVTIAAAGTLDSTQYEEQVQQVVKVVQKQRQKRQQRQLKPPAPKKLTKKAREELAAAEERQRFVRMPPGSYRIVLLVDIQETSGKNKRVLDQTRTYLQSLNVEHEVRRLTVGDFLWIATDGAGNELVLPYIVERKRMDDLASSIRDGRFHEQKHRLRQCGLPHIIYLIEDYGDNEQLGLPLDSLQQALVNTRIHSPNIQVVRTENHYRSMCYLGGVSTAMQQLYVQAGKTLHSADKSQLEMPPASAGEVPLLKFRALYEDSARNAQLSVREVFVQQLLQLHSLSLDRALAIVERYATPRLLLDAYAACGSVEEARQLLAGLSCGPTQRPLGDKLSQCIHEFYTNEEFK